MFQNPVLDVLVSLFRGSRVVGVQGSVSGFTCWGRGGDDNLLQASAPAGNLHRHLFKDGAPAYKH